VDRCHKVRFRSAAKIFPGDVRDFEKRGIAHRWIFAEDAFRNVDGKADVVEVEVAEGDVFGEAAAATTFIIVAIIRGWDALPGFDESSVVRVYESNVLEEDVLYVIWVAKDLTDGANWDAARLMASDVLTMDVCGVAFNGDAVITVLYRPVGQSDVLGVPSI